MFVETERERDVLCYVFFVQSKGFPVCEREKQHDFLDPPSLSSMFSFVLFFPLPEQSTILQISKKIRDIKKKP